MKFRQMALTFSAFMTFSPIAIAEVPPADLLIRPGFIEKLSGAKLGELLRSGATTNIIDSDGNSPLLLAAESSRSVIVEKLITAGADRFQVNKKGQTVLHLSAGSSMNSTDKVEFLLRIFEGNPDILNKQDASGDTALMVAVRDGKVNLALLMLKGGVDASVKNVDGKSAADLAREIGRDDLAVQLEKPLSE